MCSCREHIYHPLVIILHSPILGNTRTSVAETTFTVENCNIIDIIIALERFGFWCNYVRFRWVLTFQWNLLLQSSRYK